MRFTFGLILSLLTVTAWSQSKLYDEDLSKFRPHFEKEEIPEPQQKENYLDSVKFVNQENELIDSLSDALATFYDSPNVAAKGHRIQVYTGNSEAKAKEAEKIIKEMYGNQYQIYTTFKLQWRVRVGDFLDPLRAHRIYVELKQEFRNALKVEDVINVKKVK